MYIRCPGCSTVHPVNAALLAQGGGMFRCGKCNKKSNALDSLFDDWPEGGAKPAAKGELPVLGIGIDLEKAGESRLNPKEAALRGEAGPKRRESRLGQFLVRSVWLIGVVVVGAIVIFKAAEFSGNPIVDQEEVDEALVTIGVKEPAVNQPFRDLERIHLVSRELTSDPSQPGMLRLKATIVNRASRSQPYPALEVVLFDAAGEQLATYDFIPGDYLAASTMPGSEMSPHAYLPLTLELEDPGVKAVGFELNFR